MTIRSLIFALVLGTAAPAFSQSSKPEATIRIGTLAPKDSLWHRVLLRTAEQWRIHSKGRVQVVMWTGGQMGDEPVMVQKMRISELNAAALTGAGLSGIEKGVMALQIPMMYDSYDELDYVWAKIGPRLEKTIEASGFVVLSWGDAGWVRFFSTKPALHPNDVRKLKLFCWAGGDNDELELWRANGFNAQPLAATEIGFSLTSGLVNVVPTVPLFALSARYYELAKNMIDVKWAPLVGATLITQSAWKTVPADLRDVLLQDARAASLGERAAIRKQGEDAVTTMQKVNKLNVIHADAAVVAEWRKEVENVYPKIRGKIVPADLFDEVRRLRDEYRAQLPERTQKGAQ
jgi:TRAP-type C4-dicarboxylate transport system substrate-binding protein